MIVRRFVALFAGLVKEARAKTPRRQGAVRLDTREKNLRNRCNRLCLRFLRAAIRNDRETINIYDIVIWTFIPTVILS